MYNIYSARAGSLLGVCANVVCLLSVMMQPYMPDISQKIQDQLQVCNPVIYLVKIILHCLHVLHILYILYIPQASPECNVLMDEFVPFLQPGHKIGKVGTIHKYCSN